MTLSWKPKMPSQAARGFGTIHRPGPTICTVPLWLISPILPGSTKWRPIWNIDQFLTSNGMRSWVNHEMRKSRRKWAKGDREGEEEGEDIHQTSWLKAHRCWWCASAHGGGQRHWAEERVSLGAPAEILLHLAYLWSLYHPERNISLMILK